MTEGAVHDAGSDPRDRRAFRQLLVLSLLLLALYASISVLSSQFAWGTRASRRPIVLFMGLMSGAFVLHLIALRIAVRLRRAARAGLLIVVAGLIYRLVLLPSHPIQEIDIYRYMWDGLVTANGISPYQFSPRDVLEFDGTPADSELRRLTELRDSSDSIRTTLSRIHFEHLTTIYPPVSQAVFAAAAVMSPQQAATRTRLIVTKAMLLVFDILTMLGLLKLLRHFRKPDGWLVVYAWSPLVLKEIANSGHLDTIAICLSVWAIAWWLEALNRRSLTRLLGAAAALGLGVGAKLYPIVFVPVIAVSTARRAGWKQVTLAAFVFTAVSIGALWPMTGVHHDEARLATVSPGAQESASASGDTGARSKPSRATSNGLSAFMSAWRINDLVFSAIHKNLTVNSDAWFSVLPDHYRISLRRLFTQSGELSDRQAAFFAARLISGGGHLVIALLLAASAWHATDRRLPALLFLTVAWFWFLLPTLNPWYWMWAMPLLPFARCRTWLLMSGLVVVYYYRFWLKYHLMYGPVLGFDYSGVRFYDDIIVWLEYVPFLVVLCIEWRRRKRARRRVLEGIRELRHASTNADSMQGRQQEI